MAGKTEVITGFVEAVSTKQGKKGPQFGIKLNDEWYNGFGPCPCEKGEEIELHFTISGDEGQWKNVQKVIRGNAQPVVPSTEAAPKAAPATKTTPSLPKKEITLPPVEDIVEKSIQLAGQLTGNLDTEANADLRARLDIFAELMADRRTDMIQKYKNLNMDRYTN